MGEDERMARMKNEEDSAGFYVQGEPFLQGMRLNPFPRLERATKPHERVQMSLSQIRKTARARGGSRCTKIRLSFPMTSRTEEGRSDTNRPVARC